MTHPVLELMQQRLEDGSLPRHRDDDARLALVVEGGSSRAAFGGDMVVEMERRGLLPSIDAVYGSSAGALNGAWLLCGRAEANVHGWWDPSITRETINPRRALRRRAVVDTDHLVDHVYSQLTPMGWDEILASDVEFHPLATDAATGESTDLAPFVHDRASLQDSLRATTRMPLLAGMPVEIAGRRFVDAGVAESVPVKTALRQGATHVLVLRTRFPRTQLVPAGRAEVNLVSRWMRRHAPGAVQVWQQRAEENWSQEQVMAAGPRVLQVSPPADAPRIGRTGVDEQVLRDAVETGRRRAAEVFGEVRAPGA